MDNMASTSTNYKAVLEHSVTTTTTQYVAIKALLQEINPQRSSKYSNRNPGSVRNPDNNDMCKFLKSDATL